MNKNKICDRDKNINNIIDNIYLISNNKNIYYQPIYIDTHTFELQVLNKTVKELYPHYDIYYYEIIDKIKLEPSNEDKDVLSISHKLNCKDLKQKNINLIFKHTILSKIFEIDWVLKEDKLNIEVKNLNKDNITRSIEIYCISKSKNIINIKTSKLNMNCIIEQTSFKLKKTSSVTNIEEYKIPHVIMQTYKSSNVTEEMIYSSKTWSLCNPMYSFEFYDNNRCIEFIKKYFNEDVLYSFNTLIPGAYKADLFRYCYLYIKGGVYTDIDNICMINLNLIINKNDEFIAVKDRPQGCLYNAFLASSPKNIIFKNTINKICENVKLRIYPYNIIGSDATLAITGPRCIGIIFNEFLKRQKYTGFKVGNNNINNYKFKLLEFMENGKYIIHYEKNIKRLAFIVKYEGYKTTSNYIKMFREKRVYNYRIPV